MNNAAAMIPNDDVLEDKTDQPITKSVIGVDSLVDKPRGLESTSTWLLPTLTSGQQELLKWLAIITMTLDHINALLFNYGVPPLLWIGRLAFPLFAFLIAYNLVVRNVKPTRYLYPLIFFALCTQPVVLLVWHRWSANIFLTLALGVLFVGLQRLLAQRLLAQRLLVRWLHPTLSYLIVALLLVIPAMQVEYGIAGVFLIPALVFYLGHPRALLLVAIGFYLLALNTFSPASVMPLLLLPILYLTTRFDITLTRVNPWFFYLYYPCHLLVLKVLQSRMY
jgi:TraX protein